MHLAPHWESILHEAICCNCTEPSPHLSGIHQQVLSSISSSLDSKDLVHFLVDDVVGMRLVDIRLVGVWLVGVVVVVSFLSFLSPFFLCVFAFFASLSIFFLSLSNFHCRFSSSAYFFFSSFSSSSAINSWLETILAPVWFSLFKPGTRQPAAGTCLVS